MTENQSSFFVFLCCGGLTRTDDLWVMSPTSCQLLHSACSQLIFELRCKGMAFSCKKQYLSDKKMLNCRKEGLDTLFL